SMLHVTYSSFPLPFSSCLLFSLMLLRPPSSTLFPYTTLFRSHCERRPVELSEAQLEQQLHPGHRILHGDHPVAAAVEGDAGPQPAQAPRPWASRRLLGAKPFDDPPAQLQLLEGLQVLKGGCGADHLVQAFRLDALELGDLALGR